MRRSFTRFTLTSYLIIRSSAPLSFASILSFRRQSDRRNYQYQPLKGDQQIRILRLRQGRDDDDIIGQIQHRYIGAQTPEQPYEAVSYTWGEPKKDISITLHNTSDSFDDSDPGATLPVTANCHAALKCLRLPDRDRDLWIDAVCINQDDLEERGSQVQLMQDIYTKADEVLIWLDNNEGNTQEQIDEAVGALIAVRRAIKENRNVDPERIPEANSRTLQSTLWADYHYNASRLWIGLTRFFLRPWFYRAWIIQEAALAKSATVYWGDCIIPWDTVSACAHVIDFSRCIISLPSDLATSSMHLTVMMETLKRQVLAGGYGNMLTLLIEVRNSSASNPMDKVYAIQGMMKSSFRLTPNYKADVSHVYKAVALQHLALQGAPFEVLSCVHGDPSSNEQFQLPSFVPNWTQTGVPVPFFHQMRPESAIFRAGGNLRPVFWLSEIDGPWDALFIQGKEIDTIKAVGKPLSEPTREAKLDDGLQLVNENRARVRNWLEECMAIFSQNHRYRKAEDGFNAFWRLLICNMNRGGDPPHPSFGDWFRQFRRFYSSDFIEKPDDASVISTSVEAGYYEGAVRTWTAGRAFCATEDGHFGWVPRCAQEGDVIAVFSGGPVPYLLRPIGTSGHCQILGECYLHDYMNGEAFQDSKNIRGFILR